MALEARTGQDHEIRTEALARGAGTEALRVLDEARVIHQRYSLPRVVVIFRDDPIDVGEVDILQCHRGVRNGALPFEQPVEQGLSINRVGEGFSNPEVEERGRPLVPGAELNEISNGAR